MSGDGVDTAEKGWETKVRLLGIHNAISTEEKARLVRRGMKGYFGKTISFSGGEYGSGILVAPDITIASIVNHPLPNPANTEARGVIEANLSFAGVISPQEFSFFATHFDNASGTNRVAQGAYINSLVVGSTKPAILAGDFNANPSGTTIQSITNQWADTTDLVNSGENRATQIDYIFDRSSAQWTVISAGHFIVNATTNVASDHYPLLSVLKLNESVPEPNTFSIALMGMVTMLVFRRSGWVRNVKSHLFEARDMC